MLATLLFLTLLTYSVQGQCQRSGYSLIGDLCYGISNQKLNFQDARSYCHGTSSNLAVIHTTLQANFLASNVRTQTGAPEGIFWIGLSRTAVGSRFTWDDGTNMFWSNFDSSFPQDNLFVAESTINGKWRTLDGVQQLFFVCSYDPTNVNPMTTTAGTTEQYSTSTSAPQSSTTWMDSTSGPTTITPEPSTSMTQTTSGQTTEYSTSSESTSGPTVSSSPYPTTYGSTVTEGSTATTGTEQWTTVYTSAGTETTPGETTTIF